MTQKIFRILNKTYAILMFISFFAGFVPVIPFIIALIAGGKTGPAIYNFFFNQYFPWVIALGSISIIIGLIGMYICKIDDLSLKSMKKKEDNKQ